MMVFWKKLPRLTTRFSTFIVVAIAVFLYVGAIYF